MGGVALAPPSCSSCFCGAFCSPPTTGLSRWGPWDGAAGPLTSAQLTALRPRCGSQAGAPCKRGPVAEARHASWGTLWMRVGTAPREGACQGQPHLPQQLLWPPAVIWDLVWVHRQGVLMELNTGAYIVVRWAWGDRAWTSQTGQLDSMLEVGAWLLGGWRGVVVLHRVVR